MKSQSASSAWIILLLPTSTTGSPTAVFLTLLQSPYCQLVDQANINSYLLLLNFAFLATDAAMFA